MDGAREYARIFRTGQHGKLYHVSSSHARGETFHIFVIPSGDDAKQNGPHNAPLNKDAVEVYGIISGQPGWTEKYGWIHEGPWQNDFYALVDKCRERIIKEKAETEEAKKKSEEETDRQKLYLLGKY